MSTTRLTTEEIISSDLGGYFRCLSSYFLVGEEDSKYHPYTLPKKMQKQADKTMGKLSMMPTK